MSFNIRLWRSYYEINLPHAVGLCHDADYAKATEITFEFHTFANRWNAGQRYRESVVSVQFKETLFLQRPTKSPCFSQPVQVSQQLGGQRCHEGVTLA